MYIHLQTHKYAYPSTHTHLRTTPEYTKVTKITKYTITPTNKRKNTNAWTHRSHKIHNLHKHSSNSNAWTHKRTKPHTHIHTLIHTHTQTHKHTNTQTNNHTHTHTHTHTHKHTKTQKSQNTQLHKHKHTHTTIQREHVGSIRLSWYKTLYKPITMSNTSQKTPNAARWLGSPHRVEDDSTMSQWPSWYRVYPKLYTWGSYRDCASWPTICNCCWALRTRYVLLFVVFSILSQSFLFMPRNSLRYLLYFGVGLPDFILVLLWLWAIPAAFS